MPSACSSATPSGRFERSIGLMLSRPRKPPLKTLLPSASSRLSHQVKLIEQLLEDPLEELAVAAAVDR